MKNKILLFLLPLFSVCMLNGCTGNGLDDDDDDDSSDLITAATDEDYVENSVFESTVTIEFSGTSATVINNVSGVSITQSGANIEINSSVAGVEYVLSGTTSTGSVKIYSDYKFELKLNGVNITSTSGPAINVQSHKRVFVVLADGTTNTLTDSSTYPTSSEDQKGCFFSEGQLLFSGSGSLSVTGNYKHGICSDDYVYIRSGVQLTVNTSVDDGIHTNDAILIDGGTINISSNDEGMLCDEGNVIINGGDITIKTIAASAKGIKGYGNVKINSGTINVSTPGGENSEGIESKDSLEINGGIIEVQSYDDCINAKSSIIVSGGTVYCYSSNNDGIDSNGTITITGGLIVSSGTTSPEEGIDCDNNTFTITGGTVLGIGGAASTPTSNTCTQRSVIYGGSGTSGKYISVLSSSGDNLFVYEIPRTYSQMTLLFSSSSLTAGSYTIYSGGSISGGTEFHGLHIGSTYTTGTQLTTFTSSSMVTQVGSTSTSSGGGGFGR
jgi:hypothetical protein